VEAGNKTLYLPNIYNRKSVVRMGTAMGQTVNCDAKVHGINSGMAKCKEQGEFFCCLAARDNIESST